MTGSAPPRSVSSWPSCRRTPRRGPATSRPCCAASASDAETAFRDAGRTDLAGKEASEGELIDTYLPSQLSDPELDVLVQAAIEETNAQSMRDMGTAIKHAMAAAAGRAEGARVSAKVKAALS